MTELDSLLEDHNGSYLFETGEFVEWHKQGEDHSLLWSTQDSALDVLAKAGEELGERNTDLESVVVVGGQRLDPDTTNFAAVVRASGSYIDFLRVDYTSGVALAWSRVSGNRSFRRQSPHREVAVIFDQETRRRVVSTVRVTATGQLAELADTIVTGVLR